MNLKKNVAVLGAATSSLLVAGVAFAAWTSSGAGTGSAKAGTSTDSAIAGVAPIGANDLYPGAVKEAFVTVSNPNAYPIDVTQIGAGSSLVVNTGCTAGSVRTDVLGTGAAALTRSDADTTVIAAAGSGTYKLVVRMSNDAADACKIQNFTIGGLTASIRSAASSNGF
ncbi:MAG: hypothetical protein M3P53_02460 [Actinomycetota bacterium]|nr:hypothetical protein [Actinomycetota bacterium]